VSTLWAGFQYIIAPPVLSVSAYEQGDVKENLPGKGKHATHEQQEDQNRIPVD
jgi:hypothetical protein